MELITVNLDEVVQNDFNCKIFDEIKFNQLKSSISNHGLLKRPVIRIREDGEYEVIDGRFRIKALLELGITQTELIYLPIKERSKALMIYLWLNDFSFDIDHVKLLSEINKLQKDHSNKALEKLIPYSAEELSLYTSLFNFDWSMYDDKENKQATLF